MDPNAEAELEIIEEVQNETTSGEMTPAEPGTDEESSADPAAPIDDS